MSTARRKPPAIAALPQNLQLSLFSAKQIRRAAVLICSLKTDTLLPSVHHKLTEIKFARLTAFQHTTEEIVSICGGIEGNGHWSLVITNLCVDRSPMLMRWWEVVSNVVSNGGSSRGSLSPVKHPAPPAPQPLIRVLPPSARFYCTIVHC